MDAINPRAKRLSLCGRQRTASLLAWAAIYLGAACSKSDVAEPASPDAGGEPSEHDGRGGRGVAGSTGSGGHAGSANSGGAGSNGAGSSAGSDASAGSSGAGNAGAGDGPHSLRCALTAVDSPACDDEEPQLGYYAHLFSDDPSAACVALEQSYCDNTPPPFATLSECVAECISETELSTTTCQEPGELEPFCESTEGADLARLAAETPFGPLHFTRAWLDRIHGFVIGIHIVFTARLEARFDARPSLSVTLHGPFDSPSLIGEHDVHATVTLCDRTFDFPMRVTVTADELSSGASERFEATLESLAPDIELNAQVAFSSVCTFTNSL